MAFDPKQNEEEESPYDALFNKEGAKAPRPMGVSAGTVAPGMLGYAKAEPTPHAGGQSVSGWTNYDALYAANADVANREAGKLGDRVQTSAQNAQRGVNQAWQNFDAQVKANTLQGPTKAHQDWAKHGGTGVEQPKEVTAYTKGNAQTGQERAQTERGQELDSGGYFDDEGKWVSTTDLIDDAGNVIDPAQMGAEDQAKLKAEVEAGAGGKYAGPSGLSALDEYGELAGNIGKAEKEVNALDSQGGLEALLAGQGPDTELDAMLLGSAGRGRFADLGKRYGGMSDWLSEGNKASIAQASAAKAANESAAGEYQTLLDQFTGRVGADEQRAKDTNERSDQVISRSTSQADTKEKFKQYMAAARNEGANGLDNTRNQLHDIARAVSPSEWIGEAAGGQGFVQLATNALSPQSSTNTGNVSDVWQEDDWDVWGSMTDADWNEFGSLSDKEKAAWIADRKNKIRGST